MRASATRSLIRSLIVLAAAGTALAAPRAEPVFDRFVFPGANATMTSPTGINARGDIVGQYVAGGMRHGFLLDKFGVFAAIDVPGASATNTWGVNAAGDIVGDYVVSGVPGTRAFVLRNGEWATFDCFASLGAAHTFGFSVSASGEVVGEYKLPGVSLGQPGRAYLYADGTCIDVTPPDAGQGANVAVAWTINEAGDSGGYYVASGVTHGWLRDRHGVYATLDYPGGAFTNVRGISAAGDVVGVYRLTSAGPNHGFFLSGNGDWSPLDYPGSSRTRALGINARGDIVGDYAGGDCAAGTACGWVLRR